MTDFSYDNDFATLARFGDVDEMAKLVGFVSPDGVERALEIASVLGNANVIRFLIGNTMVTDGENVCLFKAVRTGCVECVEWVSSVSDPKHNFSEPLRLALVLDYREIADFLLPLSDLQEALTYFYQFNPEQNECIAYLEEHIARNQRATLLAHTPQHPPAGARKI